MSWFDEQIKQRKENDDDAFADAFVKLAGAVVGEKISQALNDDRILTKNSIDEILKFYHVKSRELPDNMEDMNEQLEFLLRPYGIMRRNVTLSKGWYKDASGAMLGMMKESRKVVAFIPSNISGYSYFDADSGKRIKVTRKNEHLFDEEGLAFYKPFPLKKIGMKEVLKYVMESIAVSDFILMSVAAAFAAVIGMLLPKLNNILFSTVIEEGSMRMLLAISVFMVCASVSLLLINAIKSLISARITTKMSLSVQAATMMRILSLPADFFKDYSSGELSNRAQYMNEICNMIVSSILTTGLTSIFSLVYIWQIFIYAPALVVPALIIILATVVFSVISAFAQMKISKKQMTLSSKESGMSYALISGVQKIKLAGAEKRAFARWGSLYAEQAACTYSPPLFLKINPVILTAISLIGTIIMYYAAIVSGVSVADYYAFNTAYAMIMGAFMALAGIALTAAQLKPVFEMIKPILDTVPEVSQDKQVVTHLSGSIELDNVSFKYAENMPLVIDGLSLKIKAGQYVAIVGKTGCGKSTLMRLILGFEHPQKGAIYYDGKNIDNLDLKSLRHNIGVVMQNGKLFQGDIFSNIVISAPRLTLDDAWKAAELAGIAEDIKHMPMGMNTLISEGAGGVSGGQRQRLMIARAIAPKPKILMFDEATSALDNITQKKVSTALDDLKCTRIVIAHRLSTIKQCDRIIVLEDGKIIEDGNYTELLNNNGFFAELVARQRLNDTEYVGHTTVY